MAELELAWKIRVQKLVIYTNSQLVARQVLGDYEVKEPNLIQYHNLASHKWNQILKISLQQILRKDNEKADGLSNLLIMGTVGSKKH